MKKALRQAKKVVLAVETSADDTCVALVEPFTKLIALSERQTSNNRPFNGIHPLVAQTSHATKLPVLLETALDYAQQHRLRVDLVAATRGPGMMGCLNIGYNFAQGLAIGRDIPFIGVNHMHAHLLTPRLLTDVEFPFTSLLISGGHTLLVHSTDLITHEVVGTSRDIAIGDYIDKLATLFGVTSDGMAGPALCTWAFAAERKEFQLPTPMSKTNTSIRRDTSDFSFSGLLTSVERVYEKVSQSDRASLAHDAILTSFEHVVKVVKKQDPSKLVVAGGVASNHVLRQMITSSYPGAMFPPPSLCVDNAAMIAWTGWEMFRAGYHTAFGEEVLRKWTLGALMRVKNKDMFCMNSSTDRKMEVM